MAVGNSLPLRSFFPPDKASAVLNIRDKKGEPELLPQIPWESVPQLSSPLSKEAIQERRGKGAVVIEDFRPVFEDPVRGDDKRVFFIAVGDDLKE
jgi:hypothetical protein